MTRPYREPHHGHREGSDRGGDLTIKGITKEVEFDYEHGGYEVDPFGNSKLVGTLTGTINRRDWGLSWNVALDTGGLLVSEKIKIEIDFQLSQSKAAVEEEVEDEESVAVWVDGPPFNNDTVHKAPPVLAGGVAAFGDARPVVAWAQLHAAHGTSV